MVTDILKINQAKVNITMPSRSETCPKELHYLRAEIVRRLGLEDSLIEDLNL